MEAVRRKLLTNPREKANIVSIMLFWWTIGMFKKGYQKVLELEDLYKPLNVDRSEKLGDRLEKKWNQQVAGSGRPSLIKAILATFWWEYTLLGFICVVTDVVIRLTQPFLLGRLLGYFRADSTMPYDEALCYAAGIVGLNATAALFINQFFIGGFHNGMKVRIAVCSVIYRKALRLSQTALGETALGKVVNLLSNDVNRFDICSMFLHSMWSAPLMSIVVGYLLWMEARWAGMIGIVIVFIVVPIQTYTGKLSSKFRLQTALRTDERVRFMDEIISGVQVIKMYAWEWPFTQLITRARKLELKIVRKSSYVRGLYMTFLLFTTRMAIFCTMLSIVLLYGSDQLTASKVFVIAAYFNIVSHTMSQMFVRGVAEIAEVLVAMKRLQHFLEYEERETEAIEREEFKRNLLIAKNGKDGLLLQKNENKVELPKNIAVSINNLTARWNKLPAKQPQATNNKAKSNGTKTVVIDDNSWREPTLLNVNANLRRGQLIGIVGPVGAGKTSFLQALLQELPIESGTINISGSVSYASQEPWVFAGTVRQNILFGQEMKRDRYDAVVKACALLKDFEQLEFGDRTIIGERGTSLSGGQKARINLARAAYREADIYLLDDPLSAVDAHVGRHLFSECIGPGGRLSRKHATRILVTHQVHFLKDADWIIVLRDGKVEAQGSPQELSQSGIDFATLLESDEKDDEVEKDDNSSVIKRSRANSRSSQKSVLSSKEDLSSSENESFANSKEKNIAKSVEQLQQLESSSKGQVHGSLQAAYLRAGANVYVLFIVFVFFALTQMFASGADYWVSFWTRQEELRTLHARNLTESLFNETTINATTFKLDNLSDNATDDQELDFFFFKGLLSTKNCMWIHGGIMGSLFFVAIVRSISFYTISVRASQKLHDFMFKGIISTTMRFFDTNPSGRILNRFSKDMGAIDEFLPKAILDASQIILNMVGAIVVTSIVNPIFLVAVVILGAIFMYVRKIYLKTSKNIKRLEGVTRSPVFTHLSATLSGLSTIRAFGAQRILIDEFDNHQDLHTSCWYMFITTSSAFGLSLDLICLAFIGTITFTFIADSSGVMGDKVGLAITQAMALTGMLQWGIRQSAEVANQLMSVERVLEYRDLTPEPEQEKPQIVEKSWPEFGQIEFQNVFYRYFAEAEDVLKGLSFVVKPKEKIGIIGRTGAGKSSLIGAIFRLAIVEGKIFVDKIDTSTISLKELRSKISIIPQDPVLFSGTIRRNLDPFEEYKDAAIWKALEEVELKDIANGPLGLQSKVMSGGSNFSVGQRQLICLARAILRNNKILVLDEATANVDPHTDKLIQNTIRINFAECTVLTIAHRLHTIMDSDRVVVMDTGRAVDLAAPHELLQNPKGIFYEMVHTLGPHEIERLKKVALEKYESSMKSA